MDRKVVIITVVVVLVLWMLFHGFGPYKENKSNFEVISDEEYTYQILSEDDKTMRITGIITYRTELNLPTVVIHEGVEYSITSIGDYVFKDLSDIISLVIPDGYTHIGENTFEGCTGLKSLTMPISLDVVGDCSSPPFEGCTGIEMITLTVGDGSVANYSNTDNLGENPFQYTPWAITEKDLHINIFAGVEMISPSMFCGAKCIKEISFTEGLEQIESEAFYDCEGLKKITLPSSLKSIHDSAFEDCLSLEMVKFGDSLNEIGDEAFKNCVGMLSLTFPDSLVRIGSYAFDNCVSLKKVVFGTGLEYVGMNAFNGVVFVDSYGDHLSMRADELKGYQFLGDANALVRQHE